MEKRIFLNAKTVFEKQFNCHLCMHDYERHSDTELLPHFHLNRFCTGIKKDLRQNHAKCIFFDQTLLVQRLSELRKPFFKHCPAGFIEAVFPVFREGRLAGCLFAGPFSAAVDPPGTVLKAEWCFEGGPAELPPELPEELESFLALGELLAAASVVLPAGTGGIPGNVKELIREFLGKNFQKNIGLSDVARLLSLTPPRASDRIYREFGKRFCVLLREYRLNAACRLLENSSFPVEEIARRTGFRSGGYFHRIFHKEFDLTPQEYRYRHKRDDV